MSEADVHLLQCNKKHEMSAMNHPSKIKTPRREGSFAALVLLPVLMGIGHVLPAVGAIQTATGAYQFPIPVLGMIGATSALVDCMLKTPSPKGVVSV